jgi:hypothetical protein
MRLPASPDGCVFLTGAGVSLDSPSCAPSGAELTRDTFSTYFMPSTEERVVEAHRVVGWLDQSGCPRPPRLETVFGVVARCLGQQALDPLAEMMHIPSNGYHEFLARCVEHGARIVTANFDDGFEQRLAHVEDERIFHFHGSVAAGGVASLGITLAKIELGFDIATSMTFSESLQRAANLVVIGYSGSDVFDVDPVVSELPDNALDGLTLTWCVHENAPSSLKVVGIETAPHLARLLQDRGAEVEVVCGPTSSLVERLAERWQIPFALSAETRVARTLHYGASPSQRQAASYELFHELGMFGQLRHLQSTGVRTASSANEWLIEDQLLWFEGQYRTARRRWRRDTDPRRTELKDERIAACLWAEGRLLRAYLKLVSSFRRAAPSQLRGQIEMFGRVVEHMGRTVELAWLARRTRPLVMAALGQVNRAEGAQALGRRRDLVSSLQSATEGTPRDETDVATTADWFREVGSVHAALQYRHRAIRDAMERGERVESSVYQELRHDTLEIGLVGDAARIILLPGASSAFSLSVIASMILGAQFSNWQRARVLGYCLIDRVRHGRGAASHAGEGSGAHRR